jgi:hypothetical protein
MEKCVLTVELDKSVKNNKFFNKINEISLEKIDIFKYGILNEAVPPKIKEKEFEYLESKIPYLYGLYEDFIELTSDRIINLSEEENSKRISETIGVGVGLLYATTLLKVNPNVIKRIAPADTGKYLDFEITKSNKKYEIETKGTIYHSKKNALLKDIAEKKLNNNTKSIKCGVITLANKANNSKKSKLVICDDWNEERENNTLSIKEYYEYYELFLSFILDSTYYNRLYKKVNNNNLTGNMIKKNMIPSKYLFDCRNYLGQYFDRRLILDFIADLYDENIKLKVLFGKMTKAIGKKKFFLGIDENIINSLNRMNAKKMTNYDVKRVIKTDENRKIIVDSDGVIFIAANDKDQQFRANFPESEVMRRMGYILGSINNMPHECGAMCRSKEKEGEKCKKLTFREHCHFHRDE